MNSIQDVEMVGKKFNRWTVIQRAVEGKDRWVCKCDCGKVKELKGTSIRNGSSKSCGCLLKEILFSKAKHKLCNTRLYRIWKCMKERCYRKRHHAYKNYGERGIKICDEWKTSFISFYNWAISNGYKEDLTIDRIDNNGNYEPLNCKWSTDKEQSNNTRRNKIIEFNGERHTLSEWAQKTGISYACLSSRIRRNGVNEDIFNNVDIRFRNHLCDRVREKLQNTK